MTDPPGPGGGGVPGPGGGSAADSLGELGLVHLRAALDALALGVGVQLLLGAATRALVGPQAATPSGRDVVGRRTALLLGLPAPGTFLVHGACRDLLGRVLAPAISLILPLASSAAFFALAVLPIATSLCCFLPAHRSGDTPVRV